MAWVSSPPIAGLHERVESLMPGPRGDHRRRKTSEHDRAYPPAFPAFTSRLAPHEQHPAAVTDASLADLMARMGHGSTQAAMIYQHATTQRDRGIADAPSAGIAEERDRARNGNDR